MSEIRMVGVLGAGTMGNGIAHVFARSGFEVTLFEVVQDALDRGLAMPCDERRERHAAMLEVMRRNSLDAWRDRFEADLRGSVVT